MLQIHMSLLSVVGHHRSKTNPEPVLDLETDEKMQMLEVGIDLFQTMQNFMA
jgi:hypothetical protein